MSPATKLLAFEVKATHRHRRSGRDTLRSRCLPPRMPPERCAAEWESLPVRALRLQPCCPPQPRRPPSSKRRVDQRPQFCASPDLPSTGALRRAPQAGCLIPCLASKRSRPPTSPRDDPLSTLAVAQPPSTRPEQRDTSEELSSTISGNPLDISRQPTFPLVNSVHSASPKCHTVTG